MHTQLRTIEADLDAALVRLRTISDDHGEEAWASRPSPESWSAAECIAHLNLTSEAYLRILPEALDRARTLGGRPPARLRRDFMGWLIGTLSGPQPRMKSTTPSPFVPSANRPKEAIINDFERLQREQTQLVRSADGLPIHRVKVVSPFAENVRYSLYSALSLIPAHQHRHLGQAERALTDKAR